jgi:hypothetical protein
LLGDLEGAERDLDRAVKMSRRRPEAFINRAWLRLDQNNIEGGIEDAVHARELIKKGDHLEAGVSEILRLLSDRQKQLARSTGLFKRLFQVRKKNPA